MKKRRNREGYDALFLVIPHMRFPILVRSPLIGKADDSDAFALKNGEIGPLGDLAQLSIDYIADIFPIKYLWGSCIDISGKFNGKSCSPMCGFMPWCAKTLEIRAKSR